MSNLLTTAMNVDPQNTQSVVIVTVTSQQDATGQSATPVVVTAYSTVQYTPSASSTSLSARPSASSAPVISTDHSSGGGLGTGGTIAIAVAIPVAVLAALLVLGIFFWRRRKRNRNTLAQRREEHDQYAFNPNENVFVPAVTTQYGTSPYGARGTGPTDAYRGWQPTNITRQMTATTTLGQQPSRLGVFEAEPHNNVATTGPTSSGHERLETPTIPVLGYADDMDSINEGSSRHHQGLFSPGKGSPPLNVAEPDSHSSTYSYHVGRK